MTFLPATAASLFRVHNDVQASAGLCSHELPQQVWKWGGEGQEKRVHDKV